MSVHPCATFQNSNVSNESALPVRVLIHFVEVVQSYAQPSRNGRVGIELMWNITNLIIFVHYDSPNLADVNWAIRRSYRAVPKTSSQLWRLTFDVDISRPSTRPVRPSFAAAVIDDQGGLTPSGWLPSSQITRGVLSCYYSTSGGIRRVTWHIPSWPGGFQYPRVQVARPKPAADGPSWRCPCKVQVRHLWS